MSERDLRGRRDVKPGVVSLTDATRRRAATGGDRRGMTRGRRDAVVEGANALQLAAIVEPVAEPEPQDVLEAPARRTAPAATKPRPVRLRVAPPLPVTVPRAPFLVLVLVLVVTGVLGVLVINTKINENAFRLDDLHNQQNSLDQQEQQLAQDLAEKDSPGNLAAAAQRLGLVKAETPEIIVLPDGQSVGLPQPGAVTARR